MLQDILSWASIAAGTGSFIAVISFWFARGRAEGLAMSKAENAIALASTAAAKSDLVGIALADARIEFAHTYASHSDLASAETRYAGALDGLRSEMRGINDRLDRIIDNFYPKVALAK